VGSGRRARSRWSQRGPLGYLPVRRPALTYQTIVADPPWPYGKGAIIKTVKNDGSIAIGVDVETDHYSTMSIADLCDLKPDAEKDAHLYLWTTNSFMVEAHTVARAWGFEPKTICTWVKVRHDDPLVPSMKTGYYFRGATEHFLFCVRGSLKLIDKTAWPTAYLWPRLGHSVKPDAFYDLVEAASPGPRLEMFSRRARIGWDVWGHGVESDITIRGDGMSAAMTDKIEAAKARARAAEERVAEAQAKLVTEQERIAELEKQAAEAPKRNRDRDVTQIREIMLLEDRMRERYGCGFSGLAEIVRKAKKDGIEPVIATGQAPSATSVGEDDPPVQPSQAIPVEPVNDGHGGALAESLAEGIAPPPEAEAGEPEAPPFDENDEPPVPNPPEAVAEQEKDEMPW
jgi:N6-adenosine-specific RNA methylase IME4